MFIDDERSSDQCSFSII